MWNGRVEAMLMYVRVAFARTYLCLLGMNQARIQELNCVYICDQERANK